MTHPQVEAMTMATRIVVLRAGRIEQVGTPLEIFHKPANRFVAGFIGTPNMNVLEATCLGTAPEGVRLRLATGAEVSVPVDGSAAVGEPMTLGIRRDDLAYGGGEVRIEMMREVVEHLGNQSVIHGTDGNGQTLCAVVSGTAPIRLGQSARLGFDTAQAPLFRPDGSALARRIDLSGLDAV